MYKTRNMLVYFKVGNYKSIKEPVVINFNATAVTEHQNSNVYHGKKGDFLKSVFLYGPNASGKSKILDAFVLFRSIILKSATDQESHAQIRVEPFLLNDTTKDKPSFFEAEFFINDNRYRYGFEADRDSVKKEWLLLVKSTTVQPVFLRIEQEIQIHENRFPGGTGLEKRMRKNALFLSVAATWNVSVAEDISNWFFNIATIHGLQDERYRNITSDLLKDEKSATTLNDFIQKADFGLKSVRAWELTDEMKEQLLENRPQSEHDRLNASIDKDPRPVFGIHDVYDDDGNITGYESFRLRGRESEGTRKFYNMAGLLISAIKDGNLVIIDELDARLHPILIKAIVQLFNTEGTRSKAQLLAVSHDTALLDNALLRRDQICFVEKNRLGATRVSTLAEFKVRKEAPYDKNYLEGKYGAIPFIENFDLSDNGEK